MRTASKLSLCLLLTTTAGIIQGCQATAFTEQEQALLDSVEMRTIMPSTEAERIAVKTQTPLAQATFWTREFNLNPADLEAAIELTSALRKIGSYDRAIVIARQSMALYPEDPRLLSELGASFLANGEAQKAIQPLDFALRGDPENARTWSLMGAAHDQMSEFDKARQYYDRALQLAPGDTKILGNVGLSYALEGDPATAEAWLRQAASRPDADAQIRQNLSMVLGLQGNFEEAEKWASRDLNPAQVEANMDYIQSLVTRPRRWESADPAHQSAATPQQIKRPPRPTANTSASPQTGNPYAAQPNVTYNYQAPSSQPGYAVRPPASNPPPQGTAGGPQTAADMARLMAERARQRGTIREVVPQNGNGNGPLPLSTAQPQTTVIVPQGGYPQTSTPPADTTPQNLRR